MAEEILVITSGAKSRFVQLLGRMEDICRKHPKAHITLLTSQRTADIAQKSCYFDRVITGKNPFLLRLFRKFDRVFDLRCKTIDAPPPDISWMYGDVSFFGLKKPYVLLVPAEGDTLWPAVRYSALGLKLTREGYHIVLIGKDQDSFLFSRIMKACPEMIDLSGRTSLFDVASLAREAAAVVGGDGASIHVAALTGCPTVMVGDTEIQMSDVYKSLNLRGAA